MKYLDLTTALSVGLFVAVGTAAAQHHGDSRHGGHHVGHGIVHRIAHGPVIHHGIRFGHSNWHHVVPHHPTYVGAYYTVGTTHYYTQSPVTPLVTTVANPDAPPPVVEVQRPVELGFGGFSRFEDIAGRLTLAANALCLDLHYNYKHNKNFTEVYGEAYSILQSARYLHGKEHRGDRVAISRRMVDVDRLFHHVQDELRNWTPAAVKQIGGEPLGDKIAGVEALLHHLCYDVGVKPHDQPDEIAPPPGDTTELAPPPSKR